MVRVEFSATAEKSLGRIEKQIAQRILTKIRWLSKNLEHIHHEPLTAQFQGMFKLRVGDYRVVYTVEGDDSSLIIIHLVGHRREIYKLK